MSTARPCPTQAWGSLMSLGARIIRDSDVIVNFDVRNP